jgi:hypothetical protein
MNEQQKGMRRLKVITKLTLRTFNSSFRFLRLRIAPRIVTISLQNRDTGVCYSNLACWDGQCFKCTLGQEAKRQGIQLDRPTTSLGITLLYARGSRHVTPRDSVGRSNCIPWRHVRRAAFSGEVYQPTASRSFYSGRVHGV